MDKDFVDRYYARRVEESDDRRYQVGKTVGGEPVPSEALTMIASRIVSTLGLKADSTVWDLGCGNGLIADLIAPAVDSVTGVDRSPALISAGRHSRQNNVHLICKDILDLQGSEIGPAAYMYEVIQHLGFGEFAEFVERYGGPSGRSLFVGGVPDAQRVLHFFRTRDQRRAYFRSLEEDCVSEMGTWWLREHVVDIGERNGFEVRILDQEQSLYTAHYRFDAVFWK